MKKEYKKEYRKFTKDIYNNIHFRDTKNDLHHGTSKYDHLVRVSKCSFYLSKIFGGDTKTVVRAGLLHDFFPGGRKDALENSYLNHPKTAVRNARKYFELTKKEEEAIKTHMFHHVLLKKIFPFINIKEKAKIKENKPKSKEAWIVCISDLLVSLMEVFRFKFSYTANLSYLVILNILYMNI